MTTTAAASAQAAPNSQLLNRHPHPYSQLECTDSCIPDFGDGCVACLDQNSVQRPGSASHSGPTLLPATQQPITQGSAEVRTSTTPGMLAAISPSVQPHQLPQTQLAQPPALNDKLSSKISEVQRQAAELDQLPNALPHPVHQKLLKAHLVSNAGDAEAQAHEPRENQIQAGEQLEKQIQAQEQHERLVQAKQASQKQKPVAKLPLPLEQVLPRPPEAEPKQPAPAAVRPARPLTKQLALPEQLPQKLQAPQISKPALPLEVQPNLKQVAPAGQQLQVSPNYKGAKKVAELQQLPQHDHIASLTNVQTRLAASVVPKSAHKTASGVVTGALPCQQRQESLAPSAAALETPSIAQGSGLASSKKHTLECTSDTGAGSQSPPYDKKRCMRSYQAELTSQSDKAANRAAAKHTVKVSADQSPQSRETRDEVSHLPSSSSPESVSTPSVTDTSRSSTCVSDSSISCDNTSGSMLTTSNSSSDSLSDGGYGGLSWQVNKSFTSEDLSSLKSKDITVTYTWHSNNAVLGEVAVTAWVCSTNVMGWRWSDSGNYYL